jgi:hypothetical protein
MDGADEPVSQSAGSAKSRLKRWGDLDLALFLRGEAPLTICGCVRRTLSSQLDCVRGALLFSFF